MKTFSVSAQNFDGRVIGCSWLKPNERKVFKQVRPCLENLVKNKNYDLKIYKSYGNELRISAGKNPEYTVIDYNTLGTWINRAKEIIENYKSQHQAILDKK